MSNRYLFRGKRVDGGGWFIVGQLYLSNGRAWITDSINVNLDTHYLAWFEVIPETVGQATGLLDKTGKMIFEGDVDKQFGEEIKWYNEKGCYALFKNGIVQSYPIDWSRIEIVRSIHD